MIYIPTIIQGSKGITEDDFEDTLTNLRDESEYRTCDRVAEDVSTSSDREDSRSSKKLVNVQIQSDEVETSTSYSDSSHLNQMISNKKIDRIFTTHFKQYISKMSAILQGTTV